MSKVHDNISDPPAPKPDPTPPFRIPGAVFFVAVVAFLSLLPSQAPEFVLAKGWELLHLLLIAIAVSCGLFSGKYSNAEPGAEHAGDYSKTEAGQERLGFSEDSEQEDEKEEREHGWPVELGRTQLWNSLYHRPDPAPLVTEAKRSGSGSRSLCLPVRSLNSHVVSEAAPAFNKTLISRGPPLAEGPSRDEAYAQTTSPDESVGEEEDAAIGASPLPWRSQSARMTDKEMELGTSGPPTPMSTSLVSGGFRSPYLRCASTGSLGPPQSVRLDQRTGSGRRGDVKTGKPSNPSPPPTPPSRRPADPDASAGLFPSRRQVRSNILREEPEAADKRRGWKLPSKTCGFGLNGLQDPVIADGRLSGSEESSDEDAPQHAAASKSSNVTDTAEDDRSNPSPRPVTRNDVDRKAEEFIAKIRKQIRRQKVEPGNECLQDTNTKETY